jgi:hypothetical protein
MAFACDAALLGLPVPAPTASVYVEAWAGPTGQGWPLFCRVRPMLGRMAREPVVRQSGGGP